jgi:hypothetical protein
MEMDKLERLSKVFDSFAKKADPVERWFLEQTLCAWDISWERLDPDVRCEALHIPMAAEKALVQWEKLGRAQRARIAGWSRHGRR